MDEQEHPRCFSTIRLYAIWQDANRSCGTPKAESVCDDCLPSFQLAMKRIGRCANPLAVFKFHTDGSISGLGLPADKTVNGEKSPEQVRPMRRTKPEKKLRVGKLDVQQKVDFWQERQRRIAELLNR